MVSKRQHLLVMRDNRDEQSIASSLPDTSFHFLLQASACGLTPVLRPHEQFSPEEGSVPFLPPGKAN
jgi:hypothetical protein